MRRVLGALGLVSVCFTSVVGQHSIATYPIPLMVESPEKGVFIDLTKEIIKRSGESFEIAVYPPNRTVGGFHAGEIDAFFPALDVLLQKEVAASSEIYMKRDFAFVRAGEPAVGSIDGLKGKKVGITQGYPYAKAVVGNPDLNIVEGQSDEINVKALIDGRIDVFIVEEKTGLKAVEKVGAEGVHYDKANPLSEQKVYFAFQNDAAGKALASKFSEALKAMKADGTFGKIMAAAEKQK